MSGDVDLLIRQILAASVPGDLVGALRHAGFNRLFWQCWHPSVLQTWSAMPGGFLEHYYGVDADRHCAVAGAIRRRWQSFSFAEAREHLGQNEYAKEAERVWNAFGAVDGAVVWGGRGQRPSALILTTDRELGETFPRLLPALALGACHMDRMVRGNSGLLEIPRQFICLSERQLEVLRMQIDHPELDFAEQAARLGVSLRTLEKYHARIAKRLGVRSFAGAIAVAMTTGRSASTV